jgi:hypothetical protein
MTGISPLCTPAELVIEWRVRGEQLKYEGSNEAAHTRALCAAELEASLKNRDNEILSIADAARESGYNEEYLRRLLRTHAELNVGRAGKPRIRRRDLPRKVSKAVVRAPLKRYDAGADAFSR